MAWTSNHLGPDGLPAKGHWPMTSTLLWCEDKYRFSRYIAEPVNTFTNSSFAALAIHGIRNASRVGLPKRFAFTQVGILTVAIGSALFHATLSYECQLLDELPMIYASLVLSYCILETNKRGERPLGGILLPLGLVGVGLLVTVSYLALPNPVLHQVAYALIQLATTIKTLWLLYSSTSPLASTKAFQEKRKKIRSIYHLGATVFLLGFAIWNIDNIFCDTLRIFRSKIGYPFAVLLEGHGWWHILTGYGAYHLVVSAELLGMSLAETPECWDFKEYDTWIGFLLPEVIRVKEYKDGRVGKKVATSIGTSNGSVKRGVEKKTR